MATVIKAAERTGSLTGEAFNLDDMRGEADGYLQRVRQQALQILVEAQRQAEQLKQQAVIDGRRAALEQAQAELDQKIAAQMQSVLPALHAAVDEIRGARPGWLAHWERRAVHLAAAIAGRIVRRRLPDLPDVTISLVREALELAAGTSQVRILLNPEDHAALAGQVATLAAEVGRIGDAEVVADANVQRGGCRIETRHGVLDQSFDAQLKRIEEELA